MRGLRLSSLFVTAALGSACWRPAPRTPAFEVARTSPTLAAEAEPVLLNDSITVYFTDEVQPLSVTSESVQLQDERGQAVPGTLRVSSNWVTFHPASPLAPDLSDGSFHPGASYRLLVAGSPRPDAVRASDGRRLAAPRVYEVRIAGTDYRAPGLVAPLRPPASELPFVLRPAETPQSVAADRPRLRLHFTLPLLPSTVDVDSFVVRFAPDSERLRPRSARVVRSRLDTYDGSTVEIDLGAVPQLANGTSIGTLRPGTLLSVEIAANAGLTDYAGNRPLPADVQYWSVVEGDAITLAEWPAPDETRFLDEDPLMPGFELRAEVIRPRVRKEAGDGSLGVFRPTVDTVLRPGVPFDRGDGKHVTSRGDVFPFLAIDVKKGVKVTIDASSGPVRLLSCGGIDISGEVEVAGAPRPWNERRLGSVAAASELLESSSVGFLAAGDVWLRGAVVATSPSRANESPLLIASAGRILLTGTLPYNTLLAFEEGDGRAISGPLGQANALPAAFTPGVAEGTDVVVRGFTSWQKLPLDRDSGVVRFAGGDDALHVSWQVVPPHAQRPDEPDTRSGALPRPQRVVDRDLLTMPPGSFARLQFEAHATASTPLPSIADVRIVDR